MSKLLSKLGDFWTHHKLTVTLEGIANKIFLMIELRLIPLPSRYNLGDDRSIVQLLFSYSFDQGFGCVELCWVTEENRRTVLCSPIVSLLIGGRRIVNGKKDLKQLFIGDDPRIKGNLYGFGMARLSATHSVVRRVI